MSARAPLIAPTPKLPHRGCVSRFGTALTTLQAVLACGCLTLNPAYDEPTGGHAAGDGSSTGGLATGPATGATTAAGTSSTAATTGVGSGAASTGVTTTATTTGAATTGSGGVEPGIHTVPPTVATCVLVATMNAPHGGPAICSANADAQNGTALTGLMMIDIAVNLLDGMGRPAHSYMRFDIPAEFAGLTVAGARLYVQVADGPPPDLPQSGVLVLTDAFDAASLERAAPATASQLAADMGAAMASQWLEWPIPPEHVVAGQPLFLGLMPTDDMGVEIRGASTSPGAPYLELDLQ